ncbi:MAG: hypothetical protein M0Z65_12940 [Firmicutes bacterium]|uniref:Uncharacterized protein n=1 Tax=Melghirimyces thermohalophilus TaxID=1236220 RepID=A0A1G6RBP2_9BACL|nr:hypothetical protein [Melghirimyces thermohalophilus]MDA8354052.1 hypothetical protein [Bacillota bacterium]SDD02042.1 hypothetical protein SAMN04488112_12733 [Melghirimyces thermohalophilus]
MAPIRSQQNGSTPGQLLEGLLGGVGNFIGTVGSTLGSVIDGVLGGLYPDEQTPPSNMIQNQQQR